MATSIITSKADYVVEVGTSDIWTYRKWNSGIAECWGVSSGTNTHYATVGGFYAFTRTINLPTGLFIETPTVEYSAYVGGGYALTGTIGTLNSATQLVLYALANSSGSQTVRFQPYCIGRWKQ